MSLSIIISRFIRHTLELLLLANNPLTFTALKIWPSDTSLTSAYFIPNDWSFLWSVLWLQQAYEVRIDSRRTINIGLWHQDTLPVQLYVIPMQDTQDAITVLLTLHMASLLLTLHMASLLLTLHMASLLLTLHMASLLLTLYMWHDWHLKLYLKHDNNYWIFLFGLHISH